MSEEKDKTGLEWKNWVQGHHDCTPYGFCHKLYGVVKQDVEAFNALSDPSPYHFTFALDGKPGAFRVTRHQSSVTVLPEEVRFFFQRESVLITLPDSKQLTVTAQWNRDTGKCEVLVDGQKNDNGEPYTLWQVSQKALEALFFGTPDHPY